MKTLIKKDDKVVVTAGKDRGKTGKIVHVYPVKGKVMISGLNQIKKHIRPTRNAPQGGIVDKEALLSISNVMLHCGKCNKGVRVGLKRLPDKSTMRFCKKCELEI